jgi:CoA:oxalate CoA-transferase
MSAPAQPLDDICVLDLSEHVPGPFCTKLLAGLGAEVIKVENPCGGDVARRLGPFAHAAPHPEESATFLYLNTGKKGLTLDITSATGAAILRRLVQRCDIVVESFAPGFLDRLGLGYEALAAWHPAVIYTSVTPFGQTGPYRDYKGAEIIAQAMGALMHPIGLPEREPLQIGGYTASYTTGISAFSATMLALYARDSTGQGQHVDVSAMETMTVAQIHASIQQQFGRTPTRRANTLVPARDGWVHAGLERGVRADTWVRLCELMGKPELADDPKFATSAARREHQQEFLAVISAWTASRPKEEIYHILQELRTVAGYVATVEDLFRSEQLLARAFFHTLEHAVVGQARYPGGLVNMQGVEWQQTAAPLLGEHNVEIYCNRLGYTSEDLAHLRGQGII